MRSLFLGFLGLFISFILILIISKFLNLRKDKPKKRNILLYSLIGILAIIGLAIYGIFNFQQEQERDTLVNVIVFSLLLTPPLEEIIYRRIILQHFLNLSSRKIKIRDLFSSFLVAISLIVPTFLFLSLGWLGSFSLKKIIYIPFFTLFPIATIFIVSNLKIQTRLNQYIILISQAAIFAFGHGVYATMMHFYSGIIYGLVYFRSKSIIPPLVAHYMWNLIVFFYSL